MSSTQRSGTSSSRGTAWDEVAERDARVDQRHARGRHVLGHAKGEPDSEIRGELTLSEELANQAVVRRLLRARTRTVRVIVAGEGRETRGV